MLKTASVDDPGADPGLGEVALEAVLQLPAVDQLAFDTPSQYTWAWTAGMLEARATKKRSGDFLSFINWIGDWDYFGSASCI